MTLSHIALTASLTALTLCPTAYIIGYRTAFYDEPRTMRVELAWPQTTEEALDQAVGSAKRIQVPK